jgi:hypothetical protein
MTLSFNPTSLINNEQYNLEDSNTEFIEQPEEKVEKVEETNEHKEENKEENKEKKISIPFWSENPNILFDSKYILEFFPIDTMSFNQKLNAITRLVIILTFLSFLYTKKSRILIVSLISLICIFLMHFSNKEMQKDLEEGFREGINKLEKPYDRFGPFEKIEKSPHLFDPSKPSNPMSNVLLTDYDYNPNKKPAAPAYTKENTKIISDETKKMVQMFHPEQENLDEKLYRDSVDNLEFEQSMRQFYTTANTTIPNDQKSFAEFCYGDMISAKEGNMFAAVRDNPRYNLH